MVANLKFIVSKDISFIIRNTKTPLSDSISSLIGSRLLNGLLMNYMQSISQGYLMRAVQLVSIKEARYFSKVY